MAEIRTLLCELGDGVKASDWKLAERAFVMSAQLLATPPAHPVLAPVVREPLTKEPLTKGRIEDAWMECRARARQFCFEAGVRFAEKFHGIQATTGEAS